MMKYQHPLIAAGIFACVAFLLMSVFSTVAVGNDLNLLFMGDNGHHQPSRRFRELAPALAQRGIHLRYTDRMTDINPETLAKFDGLVLYANIDEIEGDQAKALLDYVASGKGFIPLHCATFCWRNNADIVALMGAQFQRHGGRVFTTQIASADHPIMQGYGSFSSWDETYIHHLHNEKDRTVLEYRVEGEQAEGNKREPWTWIRTHGEGRVFYTAWGHDDRTFSNPGFHNLVERGIRWACGDDPSKVPAFSERERFVAPEMTKLGDDVAKFEYVDVGPKIPNYTPSRQWGTQGKPKTLMQMPLSPEASMQHFVTPKGLEVERYADERDFESKPIAMTWDERGRLWICETLDYPNELGKDRDRIRICEDTDGDLVADKFTIFAEGLSIPSAIVIVRGGAIVQNGTETIFLKDTDGDDVADEKRTLITGWRLGDTHGGVSNFRYGLDNWIWAMQGYNESRPEFGGQQSQSFRQGFWRFKLSESGPVEVTELEFMRSSNNNTWGLGISEEGLIFGSTANHNPSMFMTIPNRYYERVRGWAPRTLGTIADTHEFDPVTENVRQVDHHGGYTAAAGHSLYTARAFPQQWWNRTAFVCGPTGHLVGTFVLNRDGADYESESPVNLLASDDEWSAPIMAEVGPDGAVWVLDWYNYIVQHNPTPNGFETGRGAAYESDLRDKRHGRIYRIVPEDRARLHSFSSLADADAESLVQTLAHPSMRWRLQAQRLLVENPEQIDSSIVTQLRELVADESVDATGLNVGAIHGLYTLAAVGQLDLTTLASGLQHPSAGVRRTAVAVLPHDESALNLLMERRDVFADTDPQVKLQAVLTLADMPTSDQAAKMTVQLILTNDDRVIADALTAAAATHAVPFLQAAAVTENGTSETLLRITARVAEHVGRGKPGAESLASIVGSLADADSSVATSIVDGLVAGLPRDLSLESAELDTALATAFEQTDAATQVKLLRLATQVDSKVLASKAEAIIERIADQLSDDEVEDAMRIAAARDLIGFQANSPDAVEAVFEAITPQVSPELAVSLIGTVRRSRADDGGEVILESLATLSPSIKSAAIDVLLSKPAWAAALMEAAAERTFDLDELSLEQKQSLRSLPDAKLKARAEEVLAMGGGLPDADRDRVLQELMPITKLSGDAQAGQAIFKKVCANCHQYGDIGQKIGPNLTGMAVHPKEELLTHILDPSRSVEGNYRMYNVLTLDGLVINGMLAGESKTSVTIVDAQAKSRDILREDIDQLIVSRKSVMPEGFEQQLSKEELTDLLEFLTDTGPYVPLPLDKVATAISTKGLFSDSDNGPDRMIFDDWEPKIFKGIPFVLTDPEGQSTPNIILLNGPFGPLPPRMPKQVALDLGTPVKAIHMLGGVGGWNFPYDRNKTVSMIVRIRYEDGKTEDHELLNGVHIADYIRRVDVPESEFAFDLRGQQLRYLAVNPKRAATVESVELIKGGDNSAPIIMAVTIERRSDDKATSNPSDDESQQESDPQSEAQSSARATAKRSLKEAVGDRFKLGVGVGHRILSSEADASLIRQHFSILTPENCMKPQGIHPAEDEWNFAATDAFVDFARENQLEVVGHCLVWAKDDRTDQWMMEEGGEPVSREELLRRIESHVSTIVGRYGDAVTMWDVVNEAIGDSDSGLLRDSVYSRTTGMDFIVTAFKAARAADPDALLIYNDYNGHKPGKRKKLIELLTKLKAAGAPVDAYGMQGHFELGDDSLPQLRETFDALRDLGLKVVVSELDIDVVKRGRWWADGGKYRDELRSFDPYKDGLPAEIEQQVIEQYVAVFQLFDEYSDVITRVSFWNLHDGQSWLNYFPWDRTNYPLLFDRDRQPKPAFDAVYKLLTE